MLDWTARWRLAVFALVCGAACLGASRASLAQARPSLLIMPIVGGSEQSAQAESGFRAAATRLGRHEVDTAEATRAQLEWAADVGLECDTDDVTCLSKVGLLTSRRFVVTLRLTPAKGKMRLVGALIDTDRGAWVARAEEAIPAGPVKSAATERLAMALLAPELLPVSLDVRVNEPGAEVLLDGVLLGESPLPGPSHDVDSGEHVVVVQKEGFSPWERTVRLQPGVMLRLEAKLQPLEADEIHEEPAPAVGLSKGLVWASFAGTGIGAVGAASAGAAAVFFDSVFANPAVPLEEREAAWRYGVGLTVLAASSGVVAVASGASGVLLWTAGE